MPPKSNVFSIDKDVARAQTAGRALVALESTVITHGLPYPENLEVARQMEQQVRQHDAIPATIAVIDGQIVVGLSARQLELLAADREARKISLRDFGAAIAQKASGGTTVAATLFAAQRAGLQVFATGGIGGVHRGERLDISADLMQLATTPLVVVCAGTKAILDLPATLEALETLGVPVVGYQTDEFPAFYSRSSGLPLSQRAGSPAEVAAIASAHWSLGLNSAVLLVVPPPEDAAMPADDIERIIAHALQDAETEGISGPASTPYLLVRVSQLSGGESMRANLSLLRNNASIAAQVARQLALSKHPLA